MKSHFRARSSCALLVGTILGTTPALAQDAGTTDPVTADPAQTATAPDPLAVAPEEEVIVTGSRIRRPTIDTPTPVVTVGGQELLETGDTELGEALAELPSLSSTLNDATVAGNVQNSGLSSINLRNLGDNRTLVLIDGRRRMVGGRAVLSFPCG